MTQLETLLTANPLTAQAAIACLEPLAATELQATPRAVVYAGGGLFLAAPNWISADEARFACVMAAEIPNLLGALIAIRDAHRPGESRVVADEALTHAEGALRLAFDGVKAYPGIV
jgi:hypothetical protein